jgi:hypothetical protein
VSRRSSKEPSLLFLSQSIALALNHERVAVMQQTIEDRGGEHVIAEDSAPLGHELIGRDQKAAALVPPRDELEEEMRAAPFKREVAELVDLCGAPHKSTNATPAVMWSEAATTGVKRTAILIPTPHYW